MKPLFTNKCTYTKEVYREGLFGYSKHSVVVSIVSLSFLIIITASQLVQRTFSFEYLLMLIVLVLTIISLILFMFLKSDMTYKRTIEVYHEEIIATTSFFDDHIVSIAQPSNAMFTIRYDQIKRVICTKHLYILVIGFAMYQSVRKNGFDSINMIDFKKFIREKAPKAKFQL